MMNNAKPYQTLRHTMDHSVIEIRTLSDSGYVLRCSREGLEFIPGQHLSVGPKDDLNMREYSIYSSDKDDYLEILVKEIPEGFVSKSLKKLKADNKVKIEGPFGSFIIEDKDKAHPLYMIATGTGISPFHCFALSYPNLPFTVLHGVRDTKELYEKEYFNHSHITYVPCVSQGDIRGLDSCDYAHPFQGRTTTYLREEDIDTKGIFFLCGNCDMIYEAYDILQNKGVSSENIRAEVYF